MPAQRIGWLERLSESIDEASLGSRDSRDLPAWAVRSSARWAMAAAARSGRKTSIGGTPSGAEIPATKTSWTT
jgi:hypothetical protein